MAATQHLTTILATVHRDGPEHGQIAAIMIRREERNAPAEPVDLPAQNVTLPELLALYHDDDLLSWHAAIEAELANRGLP